MGVTRTNRCGLTAYDGTVRHLSTLQAQARPTARRARLERYQPNLWLRWIACEKVLQCHRQHLQADRRAVCREVPPLPFDSSAELVRVWEIASGRKIAGFLPNESLPTSGSFMSPDGRWLALWPGRYGDFLGLTIRHFPSLETRVDIRNDNQLVEFGPHAFSHTGQMLAHCDVQGMVRCYQLESGQELFRWQASTRVIPHLTFTPEGDMICGAQRDNPARILRVNVLRRLLGELGLDW